MKKLQLSFSPVILGVTFNLELLVLEIKEQRRQELVDAIDGILESGGLEPSRAGDCWEAQRKAEVRS